MTPSTAAPRGMLRHLDLCSGIGGFALAARWAGGIDTVAFCEIDPYCQKVLARHWPGVPIYDDLRTLDLDALPAVDLITAGFPCQPVSLAGKRKGESDERWLWPDVARCIRRLRPGWVLLENVPGLRSKGLGSVLGDLAACGFDAQWDCIPASAIGAPHQRDRIWIVAYTHGAGSPQRGERQALPSNDPGWDADGGRGNGAAGQVAVGATRQVAPHVAYPSIFAQREQAAQANPVPAGWDAWEVISSRAWWRCEPDVARVADGVPNGVERRRGLGNAIVPAVAELILRRIVEATPPADEEGAAR